MQLKSVTIKKNPKTEDLGLPEIIYKYRDWNNPFHKTIITNGEAYFASPRDFEDPKDCKSLLDYSLLTDNEIYNKYYSDSVKENPFGSRLDHENCAEKWVNKGLLRNEQHIKETSEEYEQIFFNRIGVFSVTANHRRPKLWREYADERKGFCIGIDSSCFVNSNQNLSGGEIEYCEELPKLHPFKVTSFFSYFKQIYSKESKWKFEQEFRVYRRWEIPATKNQRVIKVPKECVKKIAFGADIDLRVKKEIKNIARSNFPNIKFIQMVRFGMKKQHPTKC